MAKPREKNGAEYYKSIINRQKKVIKELRKKAGRGQKVQDKFEEMELEFAEQLLEEEVADSEVRDNDDCPNCGKGKLEKIDLKVRKMIVCNNCIYRKVIK